MEQSAVWFKRLTLMPQAVVRNARKRVADDVSIIGNCWERVPHLVSPATALDVFLPYLAADEIPAAASVKPAANPTLAFVSLAGLSKIGPFLPKDPSLAPRIADAWPGVFEWIVYFFSQQVIAPRVDPRRQRNAIDMLSAAVYTLSQDEGIRAAMICTPDSIEIATHLWLLEDAGPIPSALDLPAATLALTTLLTAAGPSFSALSSVLATASGRPDAIARTALSRVRAASCAQHPGYAPPWALLAARLDLLAALAAVPGHALGHALLASNAVWLVTKTLVALSAYAAGRGTGTSTSPPPKPTLLAALAAGFTFVHGALRATDGFSWVRQAVEAGLLGAFVDCAPLYARLPDAERALVLGVVGEVVPPYLVYRSVLRAVEDAMMKLDTGERRERVGKSVARGVWVKFHRLAVERIGLVAQDKATRWQGATCDNATCQKVDQRRNFRQCSACLVTYYCSKTCQTIAWKDGDHKTTCNLKQQERLEGKPEPIPVPDLAFLRRLALRDAKRSLPYLRALAAHAFPNCAPSALVVALDYTQTGGPSPGVPALALKALDGYVPPRAPTPAGAGQESDSASAETETEAEAETRNGESVRKARANPGAYTLVESTIANGERTRVVLCLVNGAFWDADERR